MTQWFLIFSFIYLWFPVSTSFLCPGFQVAPGSSLPGSQCRITFSDGRQESPPHMMPQGHHRSSHSTTEALVQALVIDWPFVLSLACSPSFPHALAPGGGHHVLVSASFTGAWRPISTWVWAVPLLTWITFHLNSKLPDPASLCSHWFVFLFSFGLCRDLP